jgi:DNA-directed RNA polymerase specialized sigma subunit
MQQMRNDYGYFEPVDAAIAETLGVHPQEYVNKIELLEKGDLVMFLDLVMSKDASQVEKAKKLFKMIK